MSEPTSHSADLVPIQERLRYLELFRVGLVIAVAAIAIAAPDQLLVVRSQLIDFSVAYGLAALLAHLAWRLGRGPAQTIFGAMVLLDGIYLAWVSYATGGAGSPLRYAIVLYVITISLLASYRTGIKVVLWQTLTLLAVYYAQRGGTLHASIEPGAGVGTPFARLIEFSALLWLVAIVTASFSAVNERELRRRRYDLEALAQMATLLEQGGSSAQIAQGIVDSIGETFNFDRALLIESRDGVAPVMIASRGQVQGSNFGPPPGATSVLYKAIAERRTLMFTHLDPAGDPWLAQLLPEARNLLVSPLRSDRHTVGILVAEQGESTGPRIERRVIAMVERFVSYGTLALRNAWLLERVQAMAATDALTGVANRRTFETTLANEIARASRRGEDVSLVLSDIDNFKRLNDNLGHQTGDMVLTRVAAILAASCREFDTAARYGGEEFAVILPGTNGPQAAAIAERLRVAIASDETEPAVTVSLGVASFPFDAVDPDGLIAAADEALYESKRAGRNRVTSSRRHLEQVPLAEQRQRAGTQA